jgi:hypothetical protein
VALPSWRLICKCGFRWRDGEAGRTGAARKRIAGANIRADAPQSSAGGRSAPPYQKSTAVPSEPCAAHSPLITSTDTAGRITFANDAFLRAAALAQSTRENATLARDSAASSARAIEEVARLKAAIAVCHLEAASEHDQVEAQHPS